MNIGSIVLIMIRCLLLTIAIELLMAIIIGIKDKTDAFIIILVNMLTNPIVVLTEILIYNYLGYGYVIIPLIFLEITAVLVEGYIYSKRLNYKTLNPYTISLILNLLSYLIGDFINRI